MTAHTPEPWDYWESESGGISIVSKNGPMIPDSKIATMHKGTPHTGNYALANAIHSTKCVNALTGLNPQGVRDVVAALELAADALLCEQQAHARRDRVNTSECHCGLCLATRQARAALAKVRQS